MRSSTRATLLPGLFGILPSGCEYAACCDPAGPSLLEDTLKYQALGELRNKSVVLPRWLSAKSLTKAERLELWATALEREGDKQLRTLFEIEHMPRAKRKSARADNSLLTVAFVDPRLREEGLTGDTVGDVLAFFNISERQLHDVVCYCHHGPSMSAKAAAIRVRGLARYPAPKVEPIVIGAGIAILLASSMLLL